MGMFTDLETFTANLLNFLGNSDGSRTYGPGGGDTGVNFDLFPDLSGRDKAFFREASSVIDESLGDIVRGWGKAVKEGTFAIEDVPEGIRKNVENFIEATTETEENLLNGDSDLTSDNSDLTGTQAADDLQIESILSQATDFTAGANGFAAVWEEELEKDLGDLEKQLIEQLQSDLLSGGGIGWEFNPEEGDSIFFKLPVSIPGLDGIMKIKIRNPDGTFKTAGEITASVGDQIQKTVDDVVALPGKLLEQAETILGQSGELAGILAGTSSKTLEELVGEVFGSIFDPEGKEPTGDVWKILTGKLTDKLITDESLEGGLFEGVVVDPTVADPTVVDPEPTGPAVETPDAEAPSVNDVATNNTDDTTVVDAPKKVEPVGSDAEAPSVNDVATNNTDDTTVVDAPKKVEPVGPAVETPDAEDTRADDVATDNPVTTVVDTPKGTEPTEEEKPEVPVSPEDPKEPKEPVVGGGGGGGGGLLSGGYLGRAPVLQLPDFRPVMPPQKDYTAALNQIIQESMFEGMI